MRRTSPSTDSAASRSAAGGIRRHRQENLSCPKRCNRKCPRGRAAALQGPTGASRFTTAYRLSRCTSIPVTPLPSVAVLVVTRDRTRATPGLPSARGTSSGAPGGYPGAPSSGLEPVPVARNQADVGASLTVRNLVSTELTLEPFAPILGDSCRLLPEPTRPSGPSGTARAGETGSSGDGVKARGNEAAATGSRGDLAYSTQLTAPGVMP